MNFDIKTVPLYKRFISYFWPVWLQHEKSVINLQLEILLYRGRFQLATGDALYSDGVYYTPALTVVKRLKHFLPKVNNMLICGAGLGSMIQIISKKKYKPTFTLVELDKVVLRLAMEYLTAVTNANVIPVCEDAQTYIAVNTRKYDFIFIDIFDSRTVPDFVTDRAFLAKCRESLTPGGRLALNYIVNDDAKWAATQKTFAGIFPRHEIIENDINRIFIAEAGE